MEQQLAEMTGKLWALRFTLNKTDNIITRENEEVSKWQKTSVTNMIKIVSNVKESIKEQKFAEGETDEQAKTWGEEIENQLAEADDKARELNQQIQCMETGRWVAKDAHGRQKQIWVWEDAIRRITSPWRAWEETADGLWTPTPRPEIREPKDAWRGTPRSTEKGRCH